jgi:ABC-2 type transport system permease protein
MMNAFVKTRAAIGIVLLELLRIPGYVIPTLVFPAMFFALFSLPYAHDRASSDFATLSYIAFAIIGVTLFQFGVGIATERGRPWERYLRTLPMPLVTRFIARIAAALLFGVAAAGLVAIVARLFTPVDFSASQWVLAIVYTVAGGIPFVLFGLAIGYWCNARAAVPVANIFYLLLSYAGGLWMPPAFLPHAVAAISPLLPTRQFGELLWSVARPGEAGRAMLWLCAYAVIFGAVAAAGYRRDEKARYA